MIRNSEIAITSEGVYLLSTFAYLTFEHLFRPVLCVNTGDCPSIPTQDKKDEGVYKLEFSLQAYIHTNIYMYVFHVVIERKLQMHPLQTTKLLTQWAEMVQEFLLLFHAA